MKQQEIETKVREDGAIEVNVTPMIKGNITASFLGADKIRHVGFTTEEELRAVSNIPADYVCTLFRPNNWAAQDSEGPFVAHQTRGIFVPPDPLVPAAEDLLARMAENSRKVPSLFPKYVPRPSDERRMLELSVMDPHLGMVCFAPHSDLDYNLEIAGKTYLWAVQNLLKQGEIYGDFEEILFVIGNDYMHAAPMATQKGVNYGTTSGVAQPEMMDFHKVYLQGELLLIQAIDMIKQVAPVTVVEVSGNHDTYMSFTMARVMNAYYHNDPDVTVWADPSPYKFKHYGCNLIGMHHGSGLAQVRLAALMANEAPHQWAATDGGYREWHLGDQHRKGTAKPSAMEEQGVSVEFLPSIVVPNGWHREKSFNHQKRGAMGWVWNHAHGPEARIQVNLSNRDVRKQMGGQCDVY